MLTYTKAFMAAHFPALLNDKRGVTALEYGMIAALIAAVIIGVVGSLGQGIKSTFTTINGSL
jgi:pilus assembly protein Flp/PilA